MVTHSSGWDIYSEIASWTLDSGPSFELHRAILNGPKEGAQYLELDADENGHTGTPIPNEQGSISISQQFETVPGTDYTLTFAFAPRPGTGMTDNWLRVQLTGGTDSLDVTLHADGTAENAGWIYHAYVFEAAGANATVSFADVGDNNTRGTFLDDVVVTADGSIAKVSVTAIDAYAFEHMESAGDGLNTGAFQVSLDQPVWYDVTVPYTIGGTASNGVDYETLGGVVVIPAGDSSAMITVTPKDDDLLEDPLETVQLTLTDGPGYIVGDSTWAEVRIEDNERLGFDGTQTSGACGCSPCAPLWQVVPSSGTLAVNWNCLSYQSQPDPLITVDTILPDDQPAPATATATASLYALDGTLIATGAQVFYANANGSQPGEGVMFMSPVPVSGLETGRYQWRLTVNDPQNGQRTFNGPFDYVGLDDSPLGRGWSIGAADSLSVREEGINLVRGSGATTWFGDGSTGRPAEPGDLSFPTLIDNGDGTHDVRTKDGSRSEFDADGRLLRALDAHGNATVYSYADANGDGIENEVASIAHPDGTAVFYDHDAATGLLQTIRKQFQPGGSSQTMAVFTHDGDGRVTSITEADPDGAAGPLDAPVISFTYDGASNRIASITEAGGRTTAFEYDVTGRLVRAADARGNSEALTPAHGTGPFDLAAQGLDAANPLPFSGSADMRGRQTDELGRPRSFETDRFGNVTVDEDALGNRTVYERNQHGQATRRIAPDPDGDGPLAAPETVYAYDDRGNRTGVTHPDGSTESWVYDAIFNRVVRHTDALGNVTWHDLDPATGVTLATTQVVGLDDRTSGESDDVTTAFAYTDGTDDPATPGVDESLFRKGLLLAETDPSGAVTRYEYNTAGQITRTVYAAGTAEEAVVHSQYDGRGNLISQTDELGNVTAWEYDALDRMMKTVQPDPDGDGPLEPPVSQTVYNAGGSVSQQIDAAGRVTQYEYDELGRQIKTISPDPDGDGPLLPLVTQSVYDAAGQLVQSIAADGAVTVYEYDDAGRQIRTTGPDPDGDGPLTSAVTETVYNALGQVVQSIDPLGNVTAYEYDARGRRIKTILPDPDGDGPLSSPVTQTVYDVAGQVTASIDPLGRTTTYVYDDLGRQIQTIAPDPDGPAGPLSAPVTQSVYNAAGQLARSIEPSGAVTHYVYDARGRQTHTIDALGNVYQTVYDAASRVAAQVAPAPTLTDGLVGFWSFVHGVPTATGSVQHADLSGHDHTATATNGPVSVDGRMGAALHFDGANDYVSLGNPADLNITGAITLSAWIRPEATGGIRNIIAHGHATSPAGEVLLRINNGKYQVGSWNGVNHFTSATIPAGDVGQWVHLTGVYDPAAGQWRLYRNGQLLASTADATGAVAVNGNWAIGARGTGTERYFQGSIDEVRIYNRAVTQDEIAVLAETVTGPVTQYVYDDLGRQIKTIQPDPDGPGPLTSPETVTAYDAAGQVVATTDPLGNVTSYEYDAMGRQTRVILPALDSGPSTLDTTYTYDAHGRLAAVTDPLGRTTTMVHDAAGRQTHTIDAMGNVYETRYNAVSQVTSQIAPAPTLTDGLQGYWSFIHGGVETAAGDVQTSDLSGNGHTGVLHGDPTPVDGRVGLAWELDGADDYVSLGNPAELNIIGAITLSAWIKPEATGGIRNIIAHGHVTSPKGEVFLRINNGKYQVGSWDGVNHYASITIPAEDIGTWVHLAGLYDVQSGQWRLYRNGQLAASKTDATGAVSVAGDWAIGARGTGTERFFQGGVDEVRIYNRAVTQDEIAVLAETATGPVTQYEYDHLGRNVKAVLPDPDGAGPLASPETTFAYDADGQLIASTDPLGRVTTYVYDDLGRQTRVISPPLDSGLSTLDITAYDDAGRVASTSNALGFATTYSYDRLGRLISQTDAEGGVTTFTYDALGNRTSLTDPVSNTTSWTYDALNRVVAETNALGDSRYFAYNAGGYLTRRIDRRGMVREFQYDHLGRNTAEIWYNNSADADMDANRQNTVAFTYDAAGQLLSAGDASATYDYAYDRLGRMIASDASIAGLAPTVTLTNAYDAAGRRTQLAATIGADRDFVTDYLYDQLGRTTSIQQHADPVGTSILLVQDKRIDLTYDAASQPVTLTRYADLSATQQVAATDYVFDQAGRLTGMTHSKGTNILADYDWTFDEANRMTRFESLIDGIVDYANDATDQLTAATYSPLPPGEGQGEGFLPPDEQYTYDENGNRITNGYTVGPDNQLLSDGTHTYTYDEEGNRTSKTNTTTGESVEYTWDHRNRLTKVTFKDAVGTATKIVEYGYDYGQRWVRKTLDANADGILDESRIFVHDSDPRNSLFLQSMTGGRSPQIVLDFEKTGVGDAQITNLTHRYLWGPNVDQILADEVVGDGTADDVHWTLTDHLNSLRDVAEYNPATGTTNVIKHITYDAFGNITGDSATTIGALFKFTARPFDDDGELQNNLNRWYDLSTGRWMSTDPIGFEAGDVNLYRYVGQMVSFVYDPTGLDEKKIELRVNAGVNLHVKTVIFAEAVGDGVNVHANLRRLIEAQRVRIEEGDTPEDIAAKKLEKYRVGWNRRLEDYQYHGSCEANGWIFPNLSLLLDGTDGGNCYGGSWWGAGRDGLEGTDDDVFNRDDDYLRLLVEVLDDDGSVLATGETKEWHPLDAQIGAGQSGLDVVSHAAGSGMVNVKIRPCTWGTIRAELRYMDEPSGRRVYADETIPFEYDDLDLTLGEFDAS